MSSLLQQRIIDLARQRTGFKIHLIAYIVVNIIVWLTWITTVKNYGGHMWLLIWPLWTTFAWGLGGILIHYLSVYHNDKFISANKEAERLRKQG